MTPVASVCKPVGRAFIPFKRDLYSDNPLVNPLYGFPRAVDLYHRMVARASPHDWYELPRGGLCVTRRQLGELAGMGEWDVRKALALLEARGFVACVRRGQGRRQSIYIITDFDYHCKLGKTTPKSTQNSNDPVYEYGRGIRPNDRWCHPNSSHNPDSIPHIEIKETKNTPTTTTCDAREAEPRSSAVGLAGGGGTLRGQFSPLSSRPAEDWDGLRAIEAEHTEATEPLAVPVTPPATSEAATVQLATRDAPPPEPNPMTEATVEEPEQPTHAVTVIPPSRLQGVREGTSGVQALAWLWNRFAGDGVPKVPPELLARSQGPLGPLATTWREQPDPAYWAMLFQRVAASPFLQGRQGTRGFVATLVWVTDPRNAAKVLAGQYDDQEAIKEAKLNQDIARNRVLEERYQAAIEGERQEAREAAKEERLAEQRKWALRAQEGRITLSRAGLPRRNERGDS